MITEMLPVRRWNYKYPKKDTHKVQPTTKPQKADDKPKEKEMHQVTGFTQAKALKPP